MGSKSDQAKGLANQAAGKLNRLWVESLAPRKRKRKAQRKRSKAKRNRQWAKQKQPSKTRRTRWLTRPTRNSDDLR